MHVVIPTWGVHERHGGIRVLLRFAEGLRARGHRATLLAFDEEAAPAFDTTVEIVPIGPRPGGRNVWRDLGRQRRLRRALERFPAADVALANHHMTAAPVAAARSARRFYYVQAYEPEFYPPTWAHALQRRIARRSYTLPLAPIANGPTVARRAFGAAAHVPIVPPGIDPGLYHARGRHAWSDPPRVGVFGRTEHWKGTPDAFSAVRLARGQGLGVEFHVASGGAPAGFEDVTFVRDAPRHEHEVADWYRAMDVVLSPAHFGGSPYPPIEAMACGAVVVATPSDHVSHEVDALVAPDGDPPALASALMRVVRDGALRERLVAAGFARSARHHWPEVIARLERILTGTPT